MIDGLLASGLGGIVTGLVGPIAKSIVALKQQKAQFEHEQKMIDLESKAAIAETQAEIQKIETQTDGEIQIAETAALSEALKGADKQIFSVDYMKYLVGAGRFGQIIAGIVAFMLACVEVLRQAIRPTVTLYMIGASTWVTYLAYVILTTVGEAITVDFAQELFRMVVYTIVYLTVSIINFWFVNREKGLIKKLAAKA